MIRFLYEYNHLLLQVVAQRFRLLPPRKLLLVWCPRSREYFMATPNNKLWAECSCHLWKVHFISISSDMKKSATCRVLSNFRGKVTSEVCLRQLGLYLQLLPYGGWTVWKIRWKLDNSLFLAIYQWCSFLASVDVTSVIYDLNGEMMKFL